MSELTGVKLLLSYDVNQDTIQEYYQFVMGRYIPALQEMGLQMSEAWHTAYGDAPNRLIGFVAESEETMSRLLNDERWQLLNEQLQAYVSGFSYKVVQHRGEFQM